MVSPVHCDQQRCARRFSKCVSSRGGKMRRTTLLANMLGCLAFITTGPNGSASQAPATDRASLADAAKLPNSQTSSGAAQAAPVAPDPNQIVERIFQREKQTKG